jgi:predicted cupin superfamily sugar epimerase
MKAAEWVKALGLVRHPEGGWYRETYRSPEAVAREHLPARFTGARAFSTTIYYLLEAGDFSALHRIHQDEGWHFYDGWPMELHLISPAGERSCVVLGRDPSKGLFPQAVAPAGWLFGAATTGDFSLMGCTVAPGFDFADFEMPTRDQLLSAHPEHADLIERLTR